MGNRILYSNVRAQTGPQLRGKIQFVVRHFEFVTVEFFVAHALWFFRLVIAIYVTVGFLSGRESDESGAWNPDF